jgi:hypothetical protein
MTLFKSTPSSESDDPPAAISDTDPSGYAHLRQTLSVFPPCLCRELMFFSHEIKSQDDILTFIVAYVDRLIATSTLVLPDGIKRLPTDFATVVRSNNRYQTTSLFHIGTYAGFECRLKIDSFTERFTICIYLDNPEIEGLDFSSCDPTCLSDHIRRSLGLPADASSVSIIYHDVWNKFDQQLNFFSANLKEKDGFDLVGDFRACILHPRTPENDDPTAGEFKLEKDKPSEYVPETVRLKHHANKDRAEISQYFKKHEPFFLQALGLGDIGAVSRFAQDVRPDPNVVLCRMMQDKVIYGSGFGCRIPAISNLQTNPRPMLYFLIYHGLSRDHIARLIGRLNYISELLLCATIDRARIMEAGEAILVIGNDVRKKIETALADGGRISARTLSDLNKRYNDIGVRCRGGVSFRTRRAAYYQNLIAQFVPYVYDKPNVDYWQSYKTYIDRNFMQIFQSTALIGERYRDLGTRIDRLNRLFEAQQQNRRAKNQVIIGIVAGLIAIGQIVPLAFKQEPTVPLYDTGPYFKAAWNWALAHPVSIALLFFVLAGFSIAFRKRRFLSDWMKRHLRRRGPNE